MNYSVGYWVAIYRAHLKTGIAAMLQYRFAILIWAVWGFVGPLISLAFWTSATAEQGGRIVSGQNVSFGRSDFAAYFLTFMIFSHLTMSWDAFEFAWRVRDGNLSPHLLKPIHPIHRDAATNLAFKLTTSAMLLPIWILLFWILKPTPPSSALSLLLAVPALIIAGISRYIWQYSLAVIAFWTTRVEAINQLYFSLDSFLAGRIAPLALFPGWFGVLAAYSPFRAIGAFPVELALGRIPMERVPMEFALQGFWLLVAVGVLRLLWASGVKQYSAVGA